MSLWHKCFDVWQPNLKRSIFIAWLLGEYLKWKGRKWLRGREKKRPTKRNREEKKRNNSLPVWANWCVFLLTAAMINDLLSIFICSCSTSQCLCAALRGMYACALVCTVRVHVHVYASKLTSSSWALSTSTLLWIELWNLLWFIICWSMTRGSSPQGEVSNRRCETCTCKCSG